MAGLAAEIEAGILRKGLQSTAKYRKGPQRTAKDRKNWLLIVSKRTVAGRGDVSGVDGTVMAKSHVRKEGPD